MQLFISYSHDDEDVVRDLIEVLIQGGHEPWYDRSLLLGDEWEDQLERKIEACDLFVYAITPASLASDWCEWELFKATRAGKPVIPVLLKKLKKRQRLPKVLGQFQYADLSDGITPKLTAKLLASLSERAITLPENMIAEPTVALSDRNRGSDWTLYSWIMLVLTAATVVIALVQKQTEQPTLTPSGTIGAIGELATTGATLGHVDGSPFFSGTTVSGATALDSSVPQYADSQTARARPIATVPTFSPTPSSSALKDGVPVGLSLVNPITSNPQWSSYISLYIRIFNGVEMVLVPAGCFEMGNDSGIIDRRNDGFRPGGEPCKEPFWIDRYEVTNAQFANHAGDAVEPAEWQDSDLPRTNVSWDEADRFCRENRGGRLPTESEWEYAARGVDEWIFPWDGGWNGANPIWRQNALSGPGGRLQPSSIDNSRGDVSWVGAYDLAGNVSEWTSSVKSDYPYSETPTASNVNEFVVRGSSFDVGDQGYFRSAFRRFFNHNNISRVRGFRCVLDFNAAQLSP